VRKPTLLINTLNDFVKDIKTNTKAIGTKIHKNSLWSDTDFCFIMFNKLQTSLSQVKETNVQEAKMVFPQLLFCHH